MGKKTMIVIGAGGRGRMYSEIMLRMPEKFELVALAEPIEARRTHLQRMHGLPDSRVYESWELLLSQPKMADAAVICTMDRDHFAPAMAAIAKGYDLLLEKPISPDPAECVAIERAAKARGVRVLVCHVLRYTPFFRAIKRIIQEGTLGEVVNIQHQEAVGHIHQSHSFVRGNWGNSRESSFMLLQKSCHDMDILQWLLDKKCTRVQSFGSLTHFCEKNAPADAPARCTDGCPHGECCPYNAVKIYLEGKSDWLRTACTKHPEPTDADVELALRTSDYGRCVYRSRNDVVDHQVVNLEFEDGVTCSFTMCAFTEGGRFLRIMGTKGELIATLGQPTLRLFDFESRSVKEIRVADKVVDDTIVGGHGGGDEGIMATFFEHLNGKEDFSLADISVSVSNHMIAFAAEESRLCGQVVDVQAYEQAWYNQEENK